MKFIDILIYVLAILVSGALSIPFSAMIARKKPLLVFLLPLILGILALVFYILYWTNPKEELIFYYIMGLHSLFASVGALLGSLFIILVRRNYRI